MLCEVCNSNNASHICPKCHRFVCEECYVKETDLCVECMEIKRATRRSYAIVLNRYGKILEEFKNRIHKSECVNCEIFKSTLLSILPELKRAKAVLDLEGYLDEKEQADELLKAFNNIAIKYLTKVYSNLLKKEY